MNEMLSSVLRNFSILRNSSGEDIQGASAWLEEFYQNPQAISVLLQIVQTNPIEIIRRYASIGLRQSIENVWAQLCEQDIDQIVQSTFSVLFNESSILVKMDLTQAIRILIHDRHISIFLPFIIDASSTGNNLETALSLTTLLSSCPETCQNPELEGMLHALLLRCFESENIETRLLGLNSLHDLANQEAISDISDMWEPMLDLFDICINNSGYLNTLVQEFNTLIDNVPGLIDYGSLFEKCVSYFYETGVEQESYLQIFVIIEAICEQYSDFIEEESLFIQVLQIAFSLLFYFFDPADEFTASNVQFFELAMGGIVTSPRIFDVLWQISCQVSQTDKGKYADLCALSATHERSNGFYEDKTHEITSFVAECLDSECSVILEKAAEVITEFAPTFNKNSDAATRDLAIKLLHIVQANPTECFIKAFSAICGALQETVSLFDEAFQFSSSLIESVNPSLQTLALPILSAIISHGQTKVDDFLPNIVEIIATFLRNDEGEEAELFRIQAVQCLEQLVRSASDNARGQCGELVSFVLENICNEGSPQLALACLSALDAAVENASFVVPEWTEEAVQYLKGIVSVDLAAEFVQIVGEPFDESESDSPFKDKFTMSALALRILSHAIFDNRDIYSSICGDVIDSCMMMSGSVEEICQIASCDSISIIAKAAQKHEDQSPELTIKLIEVAQNAEKEGVYESVFLKAASAVKCIIIECQSPITPENLMTVFRSQYDILYANPNFILTDEFVTLIDSLIAALVPNAFEEIKAFAEETHSGTSQEEAPGQYSVALFVLCSVVTAIPKEFDANTKRELLQLQNEKASVLDNFAASLLIRHIAERDPEFFNPVAQTSFEALIQAVSSPVADSESGRRLMHYSTVTLMYIVLNILPENFTAETIEAILNVLPLKCETGDSCLEVQFLLEVYEKTGGQFNTKILTIINEVLLGGLAPMKKRELSHELIAALKGLMKTLVGTEPEESVATICGDNEDLLGNIRNFLSEEEERNEGIVEEVGDVGE